MGGGGEGICCLGGKAIELNKCVFLLDDIFLKIVA